MDECVVLARREEAEGTCMEIGLAEDADGDVDGSWMGVVMEMFKVDVVGDGGVNVSAMASFSESFSD